MFGKITIAVHYYRLVAPGKVTSNNDRKQIIRISEYDFAVCLIATNNLWLFRSLK